MGDLAVAADHGERGRRPERGTARVSLRRRGRRSARTDSRPRRSRPVSAPAPPSAARDRPSIREPGRAPSSPATRRCGTRPHADPLPRLGGGLRHACPRGESTEQAVHVMLRQEQAGSMWAMGLSRTDRSRSGSTPEPRVIRVSASGSGWDNRETAETDPRAGDKRPRLQRAAPAPAPAGVRRQAPTTGPGRRGSRPASRRSPVHGCGRRRPCGDGAPHHRRDG